MVGGRETEVQTKEFSEKQRVIDAFFNLVVTQIILGL